MKERLNRIEVGHQVKISHNNVLSEALILNVSYGGVLINSNLELNISDKVIVIHNDAGELDGSVVRKTDEGFAVIFDQNENSANFALNSITSEMFADIAPDDADNSEEETDQE